jgi:hypothetical protein
MTIMVGHARCSEFLSQAQSKHIMHQIPGSEAFAVQILHYFILSPASAGFQFFSCRESSSAIETKVLVSFFRHGPSY